MAVFTFLENYDLTDQTIKPFITHEGSGFGIANKGSQINQCEKIEEWLGE